MLAISTCTTGSRRTSCYTLQRECRNHSNVEVQRDDDDDNDDDAQQVAEGPHATRFKVQWGCGNHSNVEVQRDDDNDDDDDDDDAQQAAAGPHATRFNGDAATIAMLRYSVVTMTVDL